MKFASLKIVDTSFIQIDSAFFGWPQAHSLQLLPKPEISTKIFSFITPVIVKCLAFTTQFFYVCNNNAIYNNLRGVTPMTSQIGWLYGNVIASA